MEKQKKQRLDVLLVEKGLAPSREKAKAIIMAGIVYVDGNKEDKAGTTFPENAVIEVKGKTLPYVSRGGLKLEFADLELFSSLGQPRLLIKHWSPVGQIDRQRHQQKKWR